ncbi:MAG: DNA polymerase III subunit delta [Clostridia bacterium]|nr:DNA polymerase III subunit delta [Clostridia bacterium]
MELYLLSGDDQYEKEKYLEKIKENFGDLKKGINYILLDKDNLYLLEQELSTYSFFSPEKFILVKMPKKTKEDTGYKEWLTDDLLKLLEEDLGNLFVVFLEEGSSKSKLASVVQKNGKWLNFEKNKRENLTTWVMQICKENNIVMQGKDVQYFLEVCGTDKQVLYQELKKLMDYSGEKSIIDKEVIDKLCIKASETIIFDLTDALGKRNIKYALKCLDDLLENKEPLQKIMIMITKHFKMLLLARIALNENKSIVKELGTNAYAAKKYTEQSRNFSEAELFQIFDDLAVLDADSKVGKIDLKIGMEKIFMGL